MNEKWNDEQKHNIHQYERMQDILVSYSELTIKTVSLISSGALVAIAAAFMRFLSLDHSQNPDASKFMKDTLSSAFHSFSITLCLILTGLVIVFLSRLSFLISSDIYAYKQKTLNRHDTYGIIFEGLAIGMFLVAIVFLIIGLHDLSDAFFEFPIK